jgi:hypothetical protein
MRQAALLVSLAGLVSLAAAGAQAQPVPGIRPLTPGQPFPVGGFRGLLKGTDGHYHRGPINLDATRDGSALAFLIADPAVPRDLAEARRFEAMLKECPHTYGFLVIPPARSVLSRQVTISLDHSGLSLPTILDDHNVFTVAFKHERQDSSLYELFDRSQVLTIENASSLDQRLPTGETVGTLMKLLDLGQPVAPIVLEVPVQRKHPPGTRI